MTADTVATILVDDPDGVLEEDGWLAKDAAATPEEAVAVFLREYGGEDGNIADTWAEDNLVLECVGTSHVRARYTVHDGDEAHHLLGLEAERAAEANSEPEAIEWQACEPDDDGATEWWHLRLEERS